MVWKVPREAWWQTDGHREEIRRPVPSRRRADPWAALEDEELEPGDEAVLAVLTSRDDDDEPSEPRFDHVDCWTAQFLCDGRETMAVDHLLFEARDDLVSFIRWFTANIKENIRQEKGGPLAEPKIAEEWEAKFGHVAWSFPENPADWVLYRSRGSGSLRSTAGPRSTARGSTCSVPSPSAPRRLTTSSSG